MDLFSPSHLSSLASRERVPAPLVTLTAKRVVAPSMLRPLMGITLIGKPILRRRLTSSGRRTARIPIRRLARMVGALPGRRRCTRPEIAIVKPLDYKKDNQVDKEAVAAVAMRLGPQVAKEC